ncbi:MAG: hypothetical protein U9R58_03820, partial [Chloroflexota bacterium]|nr:hypothetical protein [Chloroflexota bacterium]
MNGRNLSLVGALVIILLLAAGLSACTSGSVPTETSASTQDAAIIPPDETLLPQDPAGSISSTQGAGGIQPVIQNTQQSSASAVIPTTEPTPEGIREPVNEIWGIELHRINSDGGLDL